MAVLLKEGLITFYTFQSVSGSEFRRWNSASEYDTFHVTFITIINVDNNCKRVH